MDHNNYHQPFNHLQHPLYFKPQSPVHAPPAPGRPEPEKPKDYHYAPASPSDFIYNSSVNSSAYAHANANAHTSTSTSIFDRPSRPSSSFSFSSRSLFSVFNESVFGYSPAGVEYSGPSTGEVKRSFLNYLAGVPASSLPEPRLPKPSLPQPSLPQPSLPQPSLPQPAPGFEEHRLQRQRQWQRQSTMMNMGPGPSKSIPPALLLGGGERGSNASSSEETVVVIKREEEEEEEGSSSPVPWVSIPLGQRVKRWVPRVPRVPQGRQGRQGKQVEGDIVGDVVGYVPLGMEESGISDSKNWEEKGDGVVERVVMPPTVQSIGGGVGGMETGMRMEPTIMPKMGLFKPIRWDGPSSSRSKTKARRVRAWETLEEDYGNVHLRRTLGTQNGNGNGNENSNRNRNDETEDEKVSDAPISPHSCSPKRLKTSSQSGYTFRPGPDPAETKTDTEIKQEPSLSPPPSAVFAQIPMYDSFDSVPSNNSGYESSSRYDDSLSSRSISPLTRVPTPRRVLFTTTTSNRIMTGTGTGETSQPSLRAVSKQLKKRNREMALGQGQGREDNREVSRKRSGEASREPRKKRREEEGGWNLPGGSQRQLTHDASLQQQKKTRGSSEEREQGWRTIISAGSSEEGEVSSYYENENSYSCGQQERRDRDDAAAAAPSNNALSYTDYQEEEEWCRPFSFSSSSSSSSAAPVSFETSARYDDHESVPPSLSASQLKEEEYRQAIQMVQDTCLEASKRYIRAHCVNRGARDGGGSPDTSPATRQTVSTRSSARKARRRRKHKLESRQASSSSSSFSSSSSSSSPAPPPAPPRQQRRRRRRQNRTKKQSATTPSSSSSSPHHQPRPDIQIRDSLLPNVSQICTLLWSRSQSLRLHDIDSIELHTARNMYWLLSWAETVAFAVVLPPTTAIAFSVSSDSSASSGFSALTVPDSDPCPNPNPNPNPELDPFDSTTTISVGSSVSSFDGFDGSSSAAFWQGKREWDMDREWEWEGFGEGVSEQGDLLKRKWNSKEEEESGGGGFETMNGKAGWEQQGIEDIIKRVFDEGGMLCEFLGYGEGVERLGRVREFYGF